MKSLNPHDKQVITDVSNILQISPSVVEKDLYITQLLHVFSNLEDEYFRLIFQGGTCLAKAYDLIEHMSEDCDFKIVPKIQWQELSKEQQRKKIRNFRRKIITTIEQQGFIVNENDCRVHNRSQFMMILLNYQSTFKLPEVLRTQIKLEFILISIQLEPELKSINSLVFQSLPDKIQEDTKALLCVKPLETAAEKWVALTRRVASIVRGYSHQDYTLVRHLYDLYQLYQKDQLSEAFNNLVPLVIKQDQKHYGNQYPEYQQDPFYEITLALNHLYHTKQWHESWSEFTKAMVFRQQAPRYQEAIQSFKIISHNLIKDFSTMIL